MRPRRSSNNYNLSENFSALRPQTYFNVSLDSQSNTSHPTMVLLHALELQSTCGRRRRNCNFQCGCTSKCRTIPAKNSQRYSYQEFVAPQLLLRHQIITTLPMSDLSAPYNPCMTGTCETHPPSCAS